MSSPSVSTVDNCYCPHTPPDCQDDSFTQVPTSGETGKLTAKYIGAAALGELILTLLDPKCAVSKFISKAIFPDYHFWLHPPHDDLVALSTMHSGRRLGSIFHNTVPRATKLHKPIASQLYGFRATHSSSLTPTLAPVPALPAQDPLEGHSLPLNLH